MDIKKLIRYYLLGESIRKIETDRILNKISKKKTLSNREERFIQLSKQADENKDWMLLSKNVAYTKIKNLITKDSIIICNLKDRDGKIGMPILDIQNEELKCVLYMKDFKYDMHDNFLYNLIFDTKKKRYSLEEHDEYFEKIEIDK